MQLQGVGCNGIITAQIQKGAKIMNRITSFDQLPITLRAEDIAEILGVSRANAYVIMHSKGFPKMQIGKRIMVTKDNFRAWMEMQTTK